MTRLTKPDAIEHRLLELAYTTSAKITPTSLAYFAPCSIADAEKVLDDLATRGRLELESDDDGNLFYELKNRQQLGAPVAPPSTALAVAPIAQHNSSPILAAVLSAFIPGAGHLYTGRFAAAVLWFVVVGIAYVLILPGLILHIANMISAARSARRLNEAPSQTRRLLFAPPH